MATEPINIDNRLPRKGSIKYYYDGELENEVIVENTSRWVQDHKPGSTSNVRKGGSLEYPMTPYGRYRRSKKWPRTEWYLLGDPGNYQVYQDILFSGEALPDYLPFENDLIWEAEVDALEKLKNQKCSLGVALGERKEAAELVTSSALRIVKSVHDVIEAVRFRGKGPKAVSDFWRRARARGKDAVKQIPNQWLEVQYGWNPLLSDVDSAMSALSDKDSIYPDRNVITVRGRSRRRAVTRDMVYDTYINGDYGREVTTVRDLKCQVTLQYEMIEALAHVLPYKSLGLTNPLSIVWELVPFSFAADWFLPVGTWLNTFDANLGLTFSQGCMGYLETRDITEGAIAKYRNTGSQDTRLGFQRPGNASLVDYTRTLYHSSPIPAFPSFKDPLSIGHMANALSILSSILSSSKPPIRR